MSFLTPALLAGLVAVGIPILVHLVLRERKRVMAFPSLMFMRKIPYQSVRRRAIRHWPLLLLRVLAFAIVVLAFARPFVPGARLRAAAGGGGRDLVILLDRSASMGYGDHWARARQAVGRAVQALGPGDRAALVFFDTEPDVAVRSSVERDSLRAALEAARPTAAATRFVPALRAAAGMLESSNLPRREVLLVSDFQKSGWDRSQEVRFPTDVTLTPVSVAEPNPANAGVVGLAFNRDHAGTRERVAVSARIANRGASAVADREVTLEVDGRRVDARRVSVEPHGLATVTFDPFPLLSSRTRVTVALADDALVADDAFSAVVALGGRMKVLVIENAHGAPEASLYLTRALAVSDTPGFEVQVTRADRVTPAEIDQAAVVVLNDTAPPPGATGAALLAHVKSGTGLFVALGQDSTWPPGAPDLLPGTLGPTTDQSGTEGATLGFIDYSHPAFEIFSTPRSGELTAARIFRYRVLSDPAHVIARFDDGAVAVAERRVERGSVLVWTSTLDTYWNDLALKPVFVPFVHQAIKHLARYTDPRPWYTVGDQFDPETASRPAEPPSAREAETLVAVAPSGAQETLARGDRSRSLRLAEKGFYEIRSSTARGAAPLVVAVNPDPAESDLSPLDPKDLTAAVTRNAAALKPEAVEEITTEDQERRQSFWWYLLAAGLVLLATETVLSNRIGRIGT
jgi:hypothetical protein